MLHTLVHGLLLLLAVPPADVSVEAEGPAQAAIRECAPAAHWSFGQMPDGTTTGAVTLTDEGPTAPEFPDFAIGNAALALSAPAFVRIPDEGAGSRFDFDNGDAITVEAWVDLDRIDANAYIIGKGRTGNTAVAPDNQNWAFRLRERGGKACVNFLFRSRADDEHTADWHRWTSKRGFAAGSGWHHVAVSYRFGEPESVRGYLDGDEVKGDWDMGGATERAPVVDDDDVWIGSSMSGIKSNSLDGRVDEVALYRSELPADELRERYRYEPQMPPVPDVAEGKVVVELFGPLGTHDEIPQRIGERLTQWQQSAFGFTRLPHKYDEWGIRADWGRTLLVRAWGRIAPEAGDYELLVRSRGLARLWVDGELLAETPSQQGRGNAHNIVDPLPLVPRAGMRPHGMNDNEQLVTFAADGQRHDVLLEVVVGGPAFRAEFGETSVAIARSSEMFRVLSPQPTHELTDEGWLAFTQAQRHALDELDTQNRRQANERLRGFWDQRHARARATLLSDADYRHLDDIILARIEAANHDIPPQPDIPASTDAPALSHEPVEEILAANCYRCHGDKEKGGLNLRRRRRMLEGGESGMAAVVPGNPEESYLIELISADSDDATRMPPKGDRLSAAQIEALSRWIAEGAVMADAATAKISLPPQADDHVLLRRVYVDTVGVAPTAAEARAFLDDDDPERCTQLIDRLLADPRWADNWVSYWQDVLAENPNLVKPTLNNTGPFRWWIHEAILDNKPVDRFATELILMRGSAWNGGTAGFAIATENDVPMAAKAHVIGSALLGVEMKCARCHDAPYHDWKQSDLFQMAAMLARSPLDLPASSTVPAAFFETQARESLIEVTLTPGTTVQPEWPFPEFAAEVSDSLLTEPGDLRHRLAAHVTTSRRFAEVLANRVWRRYMGAGLVEPVDDWEDNPPSDPELLSALADELIASGYDLKHLARVILSSDAYQRVAVSPPANLSAVDRYFAGPYRRRMTAEQIVDNALHAVGQSMDTEALTLDVEGAHPAKTFLNFGRPQRAWEFTTLANERDRPSLALPRAQAVADVLAAFGWRDSRPQPTSHREEDANLLQPGLLANGVVGTLVTRLTDDSEITALARRDQSVEALVDELFLQILTRSPTAAERERFVALLAEGFADRLIPEQQWQPQPEVKRYRYVSWSNHLNAEANAIKIEMEAAVRRGPPATRYLTPQWRERAEDAVWALVNSPEMVLIP